MGEKTAGVGHFLIPTAPAPGIAVVQSASANTFGTLTQIVLSSPMANGKAHGAEHVANG